MSVLPVGIVAVFVCIAAVGMAILWRPALNTWFQLRFEDLEFRASDYDYSAPLDGYPLKRDGSRAMFRAGYYARPPFDSDGVPMVDYRWMRSAEMPRGRFHLATAVSQYALWGCFQPYLETHQRGLLDEFLRQADWLLGATDGRGAYPSPFPLESRGLPRGWVSAMYQGQAASVLVRSYLLRGDKAHLEAAKKAIAIALAPVGAGGTFVEDERGVWLEEYPEDPPSHVFNGFVFALYGLWDVAAASGDSEMRSKFDRFCDSLASNLDAYAEGSAARYELKRGFSAESVGYLQLQIEQARSLARMTGDRRFGSIAERWENEYSPRRELGIAQRAARSVFSAVVYRLRQVAVLAKRGTT